MSYRFNFLKKIFDDFFNLNLSQVSELSRAIKEKERSGAVVSSLQKTELVSVISGRTTQETQKEIAQKLDIELKIPEKSFVQKDESVHLQITLSKEQYQQLLKCRDFAAAILLTEYQDTSLSSVVGFLAEYYLELKGNRSNSQAIKRGDKSKSFPRASSDETSDTCVEIYAPKAGNKTLTPKTRKFIFDRDHCCQYRDPHSGKICGSTFNLELDHKQSRWAGGNHSAQNLQVLCRAHNNHKYKKEMNLRLC